MIAYVDCLQVPIHEWFASIATTPAVPRKIRPMLRQLEVKHTPTHEHCLRVGRLSWCIGKFLRKDALGLQLAALSHDLGKTKTPDELLEKCSEWSKEDDTVMQQHVMDGYKMLRNDFPYTAEIVLRHHLFQPDPYPLVLPPLASSCYIMEGDIWELAGLLSLADCYDALHRKNSRCICLSGSHLQYELMLAKPNYTALISELYSVGIFRRWDE